jgi:hypothetical protein
MQRVQFWWVYDIPGIVLFVLSVVLLMLFVPGAGAHLSSYGWLNITLFVMCFCATVWLRRRTSTIVLLLLFVCPISLVYSVCLFGFDAFIGGFKHPSVLLAGLLTLSAASGVVLGCGHLAGTRWLLKG